MNTAVSRNSPDWLFLTYLNIKPLAAFYIDVVAPLGEAVHLQMTGTCSKGKQSSTSFGYKDEAGKIEFYEIIFATEMRSSGVIYAAMKADQAQIHLVLMNLYTNSAAAMDQGAIITKSETERMVPFWLMRWGTRGTGLV